MKHLLVRILSFLAIIQASVALLPEPTSVTLLPGDYSYSGSTRVFYETRTVSRSIEGSLQPLAEVLAGELEMLTGIKPAVLEKTGGATPGAGDISLEFAAISGNFAASEDLEDQSYNLEVDDSIVINSEYYKGVAYGTVTLLQSLVEDSGSYTVPKMSVSDSPVADYRTVMIDVARQPSSIGMLKEVVRLARAYKLRYVQLHLTDDQHFTFPFTAVTGNISNNFTYSRSELIDLVAYADARGVTLIPEFDLPGHSTRLKQSGYLNPSASDADVADPANYTKIQDIIDDMLSVFVNTPYFHMGGDESSAGSALVPFLEAMNDHLRGTPTGGKRRMLVWEGFHGAPTSQLPATGDDRIIVLSWESSYNAPWDLLNAGYEIVNASWKPLYLVGSAATYRYPHVSGRLWPQEILHTWDKDTFMHWEPGRPVFNDSGPNDPDTNDGVWNANWISRQNQVIGGQMLSWEQNERSIVNDLIPRLPVMADRLWNPRDGEDFTAFKARLDAVSEVALTIVRPIEILPLSEVSDSPVNRDYREYSGNEVTVTLRNRTKIPGTIRYETGGFNNDRGAANFDAVDPPDSSSTAYAGPFQVTGAFGIRAQLFRQDDGSPVDGQDYQHFNNWENRVRVTEFDVPRLPLGTVPDFSGYASNLIRRSFDQPGLRGPYLLEQTVGHKLDAVLTVPGSGEYFFEMQTRDGRATFYLDLDQDGVWDLGEDVIADTEPNEVKKNATVTLSPGDYRVRVDHASGAIAPVLILSIDGPGTGGKTDITNFLSLPVETTEPPPAPDPISPTDGQTGVLPSSILSWTANGATSYDVYLWPSNQSEPGTPSDTVSGSSFDPGGLGELTSYSWKIVSFNEFGSSESAIWTFTTGIAPQPGILLLHEEFDGYAPGSIIGQTGQANGQSGAWEFGGENGTFTIGSGLSGANGLVVNALGTGDHDARISHTVPDWGSGVFYMSYLWNESSFQGHAYVSGGGSYNGAFGHAWTQSWGINNTGNGVPYSLNETYRLVAKLDFDSGTTTMWVNPTVESDPPVAVKNEPQSGASTLILRFYGTDGTIDDIRIGNDFLSVVAEVSPTAPRIVRFTGNGTSGTITFTGDPGVTTWKVMGSDDLIDFDTDETSNATVIEISPGLYTATLDFTGYPPSYFLRIELP
ncbi:MAG: family 20 glycosylhydrolase [Verrucomicrobiota bacterium]